MTHLGSIGEKVVQILERWNRQVPAFRYHVDSKGNIIFPFRGVLINIVFTGTLLGTPSDSINCLAIQPYYINAILPFNPRIRNILLDYFQKQKFEHPYVTNKIQEIFGSNNYSKVLVVWDVQSENVVEKAKELGIEIQFMSNILLKLIADEEIIGARDDILRTVEFMSLLLGRHVFESEDAITILGKSKRFQTHVLKFIMERASERKEARKTRAHRC